MKQHHFSARNLPSNHQLFNYYPPVTDAAVAMKQRYDSSKFRGILVAFRCSYISTGGISQYLASCRDNGLVPQVKTSKKVAIVFANRRHISPQTSMARFPVKYRWPQCDPHFLPLYLPFILSFKDMDLICIYLDNIPMTLFTNDQINMPK